MKRLLAILLTIVLALLVNVACATQPIGNVNEKMTSSTDAYDIEDSAQIVEENDFYNIYSVNSLYYYNIFDINRKVVRYDGPLSKQPNISMVDENLLKLTVQAGTGIGTLWGFYYDIEKGLFSDTFYSIFDQYNGYVAYANSNTIIIQDIFDISSCFIEISTFQYPLSIMIDPISNVEFINNGNGIQVTYFTSDEYQEVNEEFDLIVLIDGNH